MSEYTQGVCHDGAAILKDGKPLTIEQILEGLRERDALKSHVVAVAASVGFADNSAYQFEAGIQVHCINNAKRFAEHLHAIEREFFMVPGEPDEDYPDAEPDDECLVNCWGSTTEQYVEQFRAALACRYPMQPIVTDQHGVYRFEENPIIGHLVRNVSDLNRIAAWCMENDIEQKYQEQLAQLIGYSVSGYGTLSYVSDESYERADSLCPQAEGHQ
ncbi:hypothetical protein [Vreelandella neptunia]|uniref:hypothetical protein n=1 Tax=Vreelandella neptunia TaxID=115551 RepID=UPI0031599A99